MPKWVLLTIVYCRLVAKFLAEERLMKLIISVLAESPLYFTMPLQDRYLLVKRLLDREQRIDLSHYQMMVTAFLQVSEPNSPGS